MKSTAHHSFILLALLLPFILAAPVPTPANPPNKVVKSRTKASAKPEAEVMRMRTGPGLRVFRVNPDTKALDPVSIVSTNSKSVASEYPVALPSKTNYDHRKALPEDINGAAFHANPNVKLHDIVPKPPSPPPGKPFTGNIVVNGSKFRILGPYGRVPDTFVLDDHRVIAKRYRPNFGSVETRNAVASTYLADFAAMKAKWRGVFINGGESKVIPSINVEDEQFGWMIIPKF